MPAWPRPEPPAPMSRREQVSAQQALHIVVGGIVVFLLGAGALAAAAVNHHKTKTEDAAETVSAGPVRGTPLARYIEDRTAELANARGRVTAIVSFSTYVSDADAAKHTRGLHIDRWLIAAPGGEAKDTTDVKGWRESTIRAVTGEIADFEQILPTLNQDPEFEQQTRHDLEADRKILAGLQGDAPIVFAVVVDGDATLVSKLARTAGIRLVDLAPREVARGGTVIGLRPEETVAAGDPPERPA